MRRSSRAVQSHGDRALLRYTKLFDRVRLTAATHGSQARGDRARRSVKCRVKDLTTLAARGQADRGVSPPPVAEELAAIAIRSA